MISRFQICDFGWDRRYRGADTGRKIPASWSDLIWEIEKRFSNWLADWECRCSRGRVVFRLKKRIGFIIRIRSKVVNMLYLLRNRFLNRLLNRFLNRLLLNRLLNGLLNRLLLNGLLLNRLLNGLLLNGLLTSWGQRMVLRSRFRMFANSFGALTDRLYGGRMCGVIFRF